MLKLPLKPMRHRTATGSSPWRNRKTVFIFASVLLLAACFWLAAPSALLAARETPAADLIAGQLPEKKTLKSATKMEFLSAVCAAVRRRRASAPAITQAAVTARRDAAGEIVGMVLRCVGKVNCEATGAIVAAASAAEGDVTKIADAAMAKAPNCAETIREATQRPAKATERAQPANGTALPGPTTGATNASDEGFDPHEPLNLVCADGMPRAIRASQLAEFLRANPGSYLGPCQTSPSTNR